VRTRLPIVYTSADSVFQIAAHEGAVGLETLYRWSEAARRVFDRMGIRLGRIIARPFVGEAGSFTRTYNRHDYAMPPPGRTVLDELHERGVKVTGVGKIRDIFCGRGVDAHVKTAGNTDGLKKTAELMRDAEGLVFVNLVDTDMLYGHRNDVPGYGRAVEEIDAALPSIFAEMRGGDLFVMTADHGCDPTHPGTDHTREHVPLLTYAPARARGEALGTRAQFCDLGQTAMEFFAAGKAARGESFLSRVA
jgi:phosphopentomutase